MCITGAEGRTQSISLETILGALEATLPMCALLFDDGGRLLWLSDEAARRFRLQTGRRGAGLLVTGAVEALDILSEVAQAALERPAIDADTPPRWAGLLDPEERAEVRRFTTTGGEAVMVLLTVSVAATRMSQESLMARGLAPREADVVALAAQGYSMLNVAARMHITESSARTYLKRAYRKLGVRSRAELVYLLLEPVPIDPSPDNELRRPVCTRPPTSERTSRSR